MLGREENWFQRNRGFIRGNPGNKGCAFQSSSVEQRSPQRLCGSSLVRDFFFFHARVLRAVEAQLVLQRAEAAIGVRDLGLQLVVTLPVYVAKLVFDLERDRHLAVPCRKCGFRD